MHMGNAHKHENPKDDEAPLGVYDIFGQRRQGGGVIDFRSYNGLVAGGRDILARNSG